MAEAIWPHANYPIWPHANYPIWPTTYPIWPIYGTGAAAAEGPPKSPTIAKQREGRMFQQKIGTADGQLPASEGQLYLCPVKTHGFISFMLLCNTGTGINTVKVYIKRSGSTSRRLVNQDFDAGDTYLGEDLGILNEQDAIRGEATNASEVDYDITVREEATL